jgi:hypothetical protein
MNTTNAAHNNQREGNTSPTSFGPWSDPPDTSLTTMRSQQPRLRHHPSRNRQNNMNSIPLMPSMLIPRDCFSTLDRLEERIERSMLASSSISTSRVAPSNRLERTKHIIEFALEVVDYQHDHDSPSSSSSSASSASSCSCGCNHQSNICRDRTHSQRQTHHQHHHRDQASNKNNKNGNANNHVNMRQ